MGFYECDSYSSHTQHAETKRKENIPLPLFEKKKEKREENNTLAINRNYQLS